MARHGRILIHPLTRLDSSVFVWDCRNGTAGLDWIEGKGFNIERALVTGFNYHSLDEEHLEIDQNLNEVDNGHSYYEPFRPYLY